MLEDLPNEESVQVDLPPCEDAEENDLKVRPLERIKLQPKKPVEVGLLGNASRPWILQDGRECLDKGSEMRAKFKVPRKPRHMEGIRKRLLTDFFWEQMLEEVIDEVAASNPVVEYCTEYEANFVKENFEPRNLAESTDKDTHLKYPLYGTGSSAITFYTQTIKKQGKGEILEKFRKSQDFSKPMGERLDNGWVL